MSTRITFVRHGQTDSNKRGSFTGLLDYPLNDTGIVQAQEAGKQLSGQRFDICIYGPSSRVKRTAEIILDSLAVKPAQVERSEVLREINFGVFEGLTADQIEKKFPEEWAKYMEDWVHFDFPEGENFIAFCNRCGAFIRQTVQRHAGKSILMIASKGAILCMLAILEGKDIDHIFDRDIGNAQPIAVDV